MSNRGNDFLSKALGEDFLESLQKFELWKPGTRTTLDHEEIKTALHIVPRAVMTLLIRELAPMQLGETKEVHVPVGGSMGADAKMRVTKHERDVYSGEIEQDNKKVAEFKYRSLPGIGLVILSAFELYDLDQLDQPQPEMAENAEEKIQKLIDDRLTMHDLVNKVVDRKLMQKEAVHQLVLSRLSEELKATKEDLEHERVRLAAAGVAALGYAPDIKPGDYGHSASLEDARRTYEEKTKIQKDISEVTKIAKQSADSDEYLRGMANGLVVADSIANKKEPEFVNAPKKGSPLKGFLESREKKIQKNEFSVQLAKGENVHCPDCKKNIFDGQVFAGCVCLGDDMEKKVFIKKTEDGIKVRFSRGWDQENIEMLLEVLRRKRG